MRGKKISLFLAAIISFSIITGVKADEISDKQKKLKNSQKSISEQKQKLNEINNNRKEITSDVEKLDGQTNELSKKIFGLNEQINTLDKEINEAQKSIEIHEAKLEKEKELLSKRLRAMYIAGGSGYIEILFDSKSFSELFTRVDSVKRIANYDKEIEESILNSKRIIESKKKESENKKGKVTALKSDAEIQRKAIEKNCEAKKNIMDSLEKDKASYEKMVAQEEQDSVLLQKQIKEAQKRLEEEKNKPGSGQWSGSNQGGSAISKNNMHCVTGGAYRITSPYGMRFHPILGYNRFHSGIDIGVPYGTPIYALKDGIVVWSKVMSGYGNVVMISHGDITSLYAHNSSLLVSSGQSVKGGQIIAYSGSSGLSSGPHLHFEIRTSNGVVNPEPFYIR